MSERLKGVSIDPAPASWGGMIERWRAGSGPESTTHEFRAELGLPTDRPLILTGHQAEFWHPGILAKYLGAEAAAKTLGAGVGWVVVDQDSNPPADIRYPHRDANGRLGARTWQALPATGALVEKNVPLCLIPAEAPAALPGGAFAEEHVRLGLANMHKALSAHAGAASVARQVAGAVVDCLASLLSPAPLVFAREMSRTRLFARLIERMSADPEACARTYNEAAAAHPEARMAPLRLAEGPELPLWYIGTEPMQPRLRADARRLAGAPATSFAPRALLMTAMLRIAGCDLFIHGLGGGVYDKITESWIRNWLGIEMAPTAVATATLLLPIDADVLPPEQIDRAEWLAHHARHDPRLLGDDGAAEEKARLLQRIRDLKRTRQDPAPAFADLHRLLDDVRAKHAARLADVRNHAVQVRARRAEASIAHDRTWAFPLYPSDDLQRLKLEIGSRFA